METSFILDPCCSFDCDFLFVKENLYVFKCFFKAFISVLSYLFNIAFIQVLFASCVVRVKL